MMLGQFHFNERTHVMKRSTLQRLALAAALATTLVSGCAALDNLGASASAGATAQSSTDTTASSRSPYPAVTDAGMF